MITTRPWPGISSPNWFINSDTPQSAECTGRNRHSWDAASVVIANRHCGRRRIIIRSGCPDIWAPCFVPTGSVTRSVVSAVVVSTPLHSASGHRTCSRTRSGRVSTASSAAFVPYRSGPATE
jgi:hypothetical protein